MKKFLILLLILSPLSVFADPPRTPPTTYSRKMICSLEDGTYWSYRINKSPRQKSGDPNAVILKLNNRFYYTTTKYSGVDSTWRRDDFLYVYECGKKVDTLLLNPTEMKKLITGNNLGSFKWWLTPGITKGNDTKIALTNIDDLPVSSISNGDYYSEIRYELSIDWIGKIIDIMKIGRWNYDENCSAYASNGTELCKEKSINEIARKVLFK